MNVEVDYADQFIRRSMPWLSGLCFIICISISTLPLRLRKISRTKVPLIHLLIAISITITIFTVGYLLLIYMGINTFEESSLSKYLLMESDRLLLMYLLITLVSSSHHYFSELRAKEVSTRELQRSYQESMITSLSNEVNPHMVANTLNNITALISTNPLEAQKMIHDFASLLRRHLGKNDGIYTKISREIKFVHDYVNLQNGTGQKRYELHINTNHNANDIIIPKMLLQPLVENAIKHGRSRNKEPLKINIEISQDEDKVKFFVKNRALHSRKKSHGGIGIDNIRKRLSLIYGNDYIFKYCFQNNNYCTEIKIPIAF